MKKNTAVFLDRDGTMNEEVGYLDSIDKLKLFANTAEAIRLINESGMKAVVITNQSGVARGYFTEDFIGTVHARIQETLQSKGTFINAFYYCPHHPTEGIGVFRQACPCRKPEAGMLIRAAQDLHIDLYRSYMVGDMMKDMEAAQKVGAKGILVKTGYGLKTLQENPDLITSKINHGHSERDPESSIIKETPSKPVVVAEDILDAVRWILHDRQKDISQRF